MSDFTHLHCHTEYSLLDGAIRINDLCARAKDFGLPAVAITDHGNMHGALAFYLAAKKYGLRPIIGCEVYVCHDHLDKTSERARERFHLILLARNAVGYHNLVKLVSHGAMHGFYVRPRVDKTLLRQYSEGLIALSACIAGEVPRTQATGGRQAALAVAREYADIYPGRFFLEVQPIDLPAQKIANEALAEIGASLNLPLVATNDCHYLNAEDAEAHDVLLCIQTQAKVTDEKRYRFATRDLYYKSQEEMEAAFAHLPEAVRNVGEIIAMCEDYGFDFKTYHFPRYDLPEGLTLEEEFRSLARDGLARRLEKLPYPVDRLVYENRLEEELKVICDMGFPGYFLIVQDFINWAKDNGIPVGPGRGSAAGSLAAFALRITNLDPIPYNLLFERFLNSERISMPDIDVDFCEDKRQLVIEYVGQKYGLNSVAQITTFGKMMAKGVVRDVGRALGMTFQETDRIAKLIPADLGMTLKKALDREPDLLALYGGDPAVKRLLDTAMRLEGLCRHASIHAAGLVISDKPMTEYLPLYRGRRAEDVVTQFDMKMVEKVGLVKFDFLGLRTMTVLDNALKNIAARGGTPPDLDALPLDDEATYKLYAEGNTDGIFQVESAGMRQYLRQLRPSVFEDLIAMLALYRPGPLKADMVTEFIQRKHGRLEIRYPLEELEPCLKDTYGIIVYQEQVMQIAQIVAGYSLGEADLLRRAMGKKDPAAMGAERSKFIAGALNKGVDQGKASEIFDLMEKFADYGFNKSHSAAYALISYHTAYLKTHYPTEYMAALLTSEIGDSDKLLKYVAACRDMRVRILPPDVQKSRRDFVVQDDCIIFGLGGIKNTGLEAITEIEKAREAGGPFASLADLCCRVTLRKVSRRVLESLIKAGACDSFGVSRAGLLASLETVLAQAQKKNREKESAQVSLFSMSPGKLPPSLPGIGLDCPEAELPEWPAELFSKYEKEALGFFFTSHPLLPFRQEAERLRLTPLEDCRELPPETPFRCGVLVTKVKEFFNRQKKRWGLIQVEDLSARGTCFCFAEIYANSRDFFVPDLPLYLEGRISRRRDEDAAEPAEGEEEAPREVLFTCEKVLPLAKAAAASLEPYCISVNPAENMAERLEALKTILLKHKGQTPVHLLLELDKNWCRLELNEPCGITAGPPFYADLSAWAAG
ncbi:MAG: DNA polymerase III subunit alpha [Deltaproteobacteria bacterium]|jgi:DNA polymerase-3 subunit alpha|nr:DNA polymerase III subunit alpha [Deltaproteobacteria bacterium]